MNKSTKENNYIGTVRIGTFGVYKEDVLETIRTEEGIIDRYAKWYCGPVNSAHPDMDTANKEFEWLMQDGRSADIIADFGEYSDFGSAAAMDDMYGILLLRRSYNGKEIELPPLDLQIQLNQKVYKRMVGISDRKVLVDEIDRVLREHPEDRIKVIARNSNTKETFKILDSKRLTESRILMFPDIVDCLRKE